MESDGTQETRRIVAIDLPNDRLSLDKPLLKDHLSGDYVTTRFGRSQLDLHGRPRRRVRHWRRPAPVFPPKYDDLMIVNRTAGAGFSILPHSFDRNTLRWWKVWLGRFRRRSYDHQGPTVS